MQIKRLSPTKLKTARYCRARLKAKYDTRDGYEEEFGGPALIGTLAHNAAKLYYRHPEWSVDECFSQAIEEGDCGDRRDLPQGAGDVIEARSMFDAIVVQYPRDRLKVLAAERRYSGTFRNGVPADLIIDLIIERPGGVLEVVDFKSGFLQLPDDEMDDEDQVLMNLLAVSADPEFAHLPRKQFVYFWIRTSHQSDPVSLTPNQLADYERWLAKEWQSILDDDDPKESLNPFCGSCGRRDECTRYQEAMAEAMNLTKAEADRVDTGDFKAAVDAHEKVKIQLKVLEARKDFLKEHIKQEVGATGSEEKEYDGGKVTLRKSSRTSYSTAVVLELCEKLGVSPGQVMSVSKSKADKAFAGNAGAADRLAGTSCKNHTAPSITVKPDRKQKETKPKKMTDAEAATFLAGEAK